MEKIKCTPKDVDITENTTLQPENYGGWLAVNTGTANVSVDGFVLEPGDGLDFTDLDPHVLWNKQIQIVILATGGKVRVRRFIYTLDKDSKDDKYEKLYAEYVKLREELTALRN